MPDLPQETGPVEWPDGARETLTERVNRRIAEEAQRVLQQEAERRDVERIIRHDYRPTEGAWRIDPIPGSLRGVGSYIDTYSYPPTYATASANTVRISTDRPLEWAGSTGEETRMPRISAATKQQMIEDLTVQLAAMVERIDQFNATGRNWDRRMLVRQYADSIWSSVIHRHIELRKSKYEIGGWYQTSRKRPPDYEEVLVIEGALKFIGCQHPDCAPDWFMLDGTRIDGRNTWWVRFPHHPEEQQQ